MPGLRHRRLQVNDAIAVEEFTNHDLLDACSVCLVQVLVRD